MRIGAGTMSRAVMFGEAVLADLKAHPRGVQKCDLRARFGMSESQLRNVLTALDKAGNVTHEDGMGGVYLVSAYCEYLESMKRERRTADPERRRGKLLNVRTYL